MKNTEVQKKMEEEEQDGLVILGGVREEGGEFFGVIETQLWEHGLLTRNDVFETPACNSAEAAQTEVHEYIRKIERENQLEEMPVGRVLH